MTQLRPAIVRLEQLYPFPAPEMRDLLSRYIGMKELVWTQQVAATWAPGVTSRKKFANVMPAGVKLRYAGRPERASTAEGYPQAHMQEQKRIVQDALESVAQRARKGR